MKKEMHFLKKVIKNNTNYNDNNGLYLIYIQPVPVGWILPQAAPTSG